MSTYFGTVNWGYDILHLRIDIGEIEGIFKQIFDQYARGHPVLASNSPFLCKVRIIVSSQFSSNIFRDFQEILKVEHIHHCAFQAFSSKSFENGYENRSRSPKDRHLPEIGTTSPSFQASWRA